MGVSPISALSRAVPRSTWKLRQNFTHYRRIMASARADPTPKIKSGTYSMVGEVGAQKGEGKDGAFSASPSAAPCLLPIAGHWFGLYVNHTAMDK